MTDKRQVTIANKTFELADDENIEMEINHKQRTSPYKRFKYIYLLIFVGFNLLYLFSGPVVNKLNFAQAEWVNKIIAGYHAIHYLLFATATGQMSGLLVFGLVIVLCYRLQNKQSAYVITNKRVLYSNVVNNLNIAFQICSQSYVKAQHVTASSLLPSTLVAVELIYKKNLDKNDGKINKIVINRLTAEQADHLINLINQDASRLSPVEHCSQTALITR